MNGGLSLSGLPILLASALALAGCILLLLVHRASRLTLVWGALWSVTAGAWLLSPILLDAHHLYPVTLAQWVWFSVIVLVMVAPLGTALAFIGCLPVTLWQIRRPARSGDAAAALAVMLLLPPAYLALSILIEWNTFASPPAWTAVWTQVAALAPVYVPLAATLALFHRWRARAETPTPGRDRLLRRTVLALAVAGLVVLPLRHGRRPSVSEAPAGGLTRVSGAHPRAPLVVIGLDGGNWTTIQPLIEQGRLPTFASLVHSGRHGNITALWPPYWSAPAWAAIVTGRSQEEVGIYEDLAGTVPGLPSFEVPLRLDLALNPLLYVEFGAAQLGVLRAHPASRDALKRTPVWELLSGAGVKTGVVRFPFTYPATGQAAVVISNRVVTDFWDELGATTGPEEDELVAPSSQSPRLLRWFDDMRVDEDRTFREILSRDDWPRPPDANRDPVAVLRKALGNNLRMLGAAEDVLRVNPDLEVFMLHIAAFDNICHAFWQYRFPAEFPDAPPAQADVEVLGPVVDRYLEFLDGRLARLLARFPTPPNVIIVSDHGEEKSAFATLWKGWHSPTGIFIASGPDVTPLSSSLDVSYYDIVPTILALRGFAKPPSLTGASVLAGPADVALTARAR